MTFMPTDDLASALAGYGRKTNPYDTRRKYGYQLLQQGTDTSPVQSPWQGAARLAQAITGGIDLGMADRDEKVAEKKRSDALAQAMAEPDPQKRIGLLAAYDPDVGSRAAGQWAVEQAKMNQQFGLLGSRANSYMPQMPGGTSNGPPMGNIGTLPTGAAPPTPAGFANNSGNIRSGAPGNYNGFATYDSPQAGANAHFGNFQAYVQQNPNITVAQAISKWSPSNENNTQGIIRTLAEATGINPGMPLAEVLKDPAMAAQLLDAQTRLEKGGLPPGFNADTFMRATGGMPGQPTPLTINMGRPPPGMPQGSADGPLAGQPPAPSANGVSGPAVIAPPAPPQKLSVDDAPRGFMTPFAQRLAQGAYGLGPEAEKNMRADAQGMLDRIYEGQKLEYEAKLGDYRAQRNSALQQPQNTVQNESKMREQLDNLQTVKDFRKSSAIFSNAIAASNDPTAAGDLNLVYSFATMMDPGSVVREGEQGMVRATQNASDYIKGLVNMVSGGQRISPEARANLLAQMNNRYQSLKSQHDDLMTNFGDIAERGGMDRRNVVVKIPEVKWERAKREDGLQNGSGTLKTPAGTVTIQRMP